ncbi:gliding motility protein GldN [Mesonia sp. K4-1]|uniref:type IX secretion system ring protein PorN/GldN n=1 Tax=Mesonia sp. K4-1 TaxID=2602760 RepID=UPI0011CA49E1|nr:gliding motility protein GldN [Mesonia sp. K4-1]TXK75694.1 gliding motility protein GldN [Mesonia sp. K4-1]
MKNRKIYSLVVFFSLCFIGVSVNAQSNLLNAKTVDSIGVKTKAQIKSDNDEPLEYGYIDDRDILWSKTTWEYIDLNQRINFPLLFPLRETPTRRPLFNVIKDAIEKDSVNIYRDSYFMNKLTTVEIQDNFKMKRITDIGQQRINEGVHEDSLQLGMGEIVESELKPEDVKGYRIKGYWYFDKRQGELRYRLIGIAPMALSASLKAELQVASLSGTQMTDEQRQALSEPVELFWVFYPELRPALHKAKVFNAKNTSQPITFDHLLNSRRFDAMIYKEDNVYGDREIDQYMVENSLMQLLESNRIKDVIRNFESDMWNY